MPELTPAILIPVLGAFIGWLTNLIAVRMLFRPRTPYKFLFLTFHGTLPKRQQALARKIGELVETELVSSDEIIERLRKGVKSSDIIGIFSSRAERLVFEKLPQKAPLLAAFLNDETLHALHKGITQILDPVIDNVIDNLDDNLKKELDISQIVEEKVANFSSEKLEHVIIEIMKKEFRFVELIGAVIGFIIGCGQLTLLSVL